MLFLDEVRSNLKYPAQKIWVLFEPRSNTTRRNIFQSELATAFADADAVVVAEVARLEQIAPEERLNPEKLMQDLKTSGKNAAYLPDVDAIVAHVAKSTQGGDIVCRVQQRRLRRDSRQAAGAAGTAIGSPQLTQPSNGSDFSGWRALFP